MSDLLAPPTAPEVEKHVIGSMLVDWEAIAHAQSVLTAGDFYLPAHQVLFEAMVTMFERRAAVDIVTLVDYLTQAEKLEAAGGKDYAMQIAVEVIASYNIEDYCKIVKEKSVLRNQIEVARRIIKRAYAGEATVPELQDQAEAEILAIGENQARSTDLKSMRQVLAKAVENWDNIVKDRPSGLLSKVQPIDDLLLGFRPGKLYILAARPGLGKSMLALQIAKQCGAPVAHFSMEMLVEEQAERMVSQVSELNSESLTSKNILIAKREVLKKAIEELRDLPIWWCDEPMVTPANILSQCRRMKKRSGLGLIIVDYLQLITSTAKHERRDLEVGAASKFLKGISMKLAVPVLAIASLSRKPEERTDKRPLLSDLRESGSIESDADGVTFLYREADYNPNAKQSFPDVTEIIQAKLRGGKKGRALANFDGAHSKFYGLVQSDADRYLEFIGQKKQPPPSPPDRRNIHKDFYGNEQ